MGKIIASVSCTLDGIFTGPQDDENNMVSWAMPGIIDSTNDNLVMFQKADAILMGWVNYEGLASYWPYQEGEFAEAMNKTPKYVATRNRELTEVKWGDFGDTISLLAGDLNERIAALKSDIEGSIIVPGSAGLVQSLLNAGFVDEISMIIHPVVLGSGKRYLESIAARNDLKLIGTQHYETSGSMRLRYEVVK
ncbi:dihydrofolate reductase family protein [Paenibacillus spongiae]|uniref:Dihydrofolate reductase family protein n=1 Tax=Paenibacillus spongiae TaxID=2909671 RepID=A0ABY5SI96_9BACL|nr:dihydrofolate reductase family protein [Paenibacillus spongiae]UVI33469.1 dihydrofolate reductase family protein [Paenibacillus spongiae]